MVQMKLTRQTHSVRERFRVSSLTLNSCCSRVSRFRLNTLVLAYFASSYIRSEMTNVKTLATKGKINTDRYLKQQEKLDLQMMLRETLDFKIQCWSSDNSKLGYFFSMWTYELSHELLKQARLQAGAFALQSRHITSHHLSNFSPGSEHNIYVPPLCRKSCLSVTGPQLH